MQLSIEKAIQTLLFSVTNGKTHEDYERVTSLADEYKKLITGEGINTLLRRIIKREDEEAFKQRLEITETVLPAISEKIMSPFNKIGRMDNVTKQIDFINDNNNQKIDKLSKTLKEFWGDEDVDSYMDTRFIELSFCDPNAFILVEFDEFNPLIETAKPFPIEVSSHDVLDFNYKNNTLEWIIFRKQFTRQITDPKDETKKIWVNDYKYFIYLRDKQVQVIKLDEREQITNTEIPLDESGNLSTNEFTIKIDDKNKYLVTIFEQKSSMVQGIRVGYKRDLVTDGRTCVSPFHPAVNRMKKTLKTGSEFDLTMALHAFPQKYQYVKPCDGEHENRCNKGYREDGQKCGACKGSGFQIHTSAQDSILLPLPKTPDMMMDLSKLINYTSPDINLAKFQEDYGRRLEADAVKDVFSSDTFNRDTIANTATEVIVDMQSVYDTLYPFAKKFSAVYEKLVFLSAIFTDNETGLAVIHKFPKDFKLKTLDAMLRDLKQAEESNAPSFVKAEISNDIAEKIWMDNPRKLKIYKIKQEHAPFSGKSADEVIFIQAQGNASEHDIILWSNYEAIFTEIEIEQEQLGKDFYSLPFKVRTEILNSKIEEFKTKIKGENSSAITFGGLTADQIAAIQNDKLEDE